MESAIDLSNHSPQKKRPHSEDSNNEPDSGAKKLSTESQERPLSNLSSFKFQSILQNSSEFKRAVIEVQKEDQIGIIILDKKPFTETSLQNELLTSQSKLSFLFQNDIYGSYDCTPTQSASQIKSTIIYPATQKHVEKYKTHPLVFVEETQEIYEKVTLPYLTKSSFSLEWVYNVLEHKKEADRIIYEDPSPDVGFILAPDLKWDGKEIENLYLTAIVHKRGISSMRDLTQEHIPLLENVLTSGKRAIGAKYGVKESELRVYLHYLPSYFHLHIHFNTLSFMAPGTHIGKSHLLSSVIDNIKRDGSYYQTAKIPFLITTVEPLYKELLEFGYKFT